MALEISQVRITPGRVNCTVNDPLALQEWLSESLAGEFEIENWDEMIRVHVMAHNHRKHVEQKPLLRWNWQTNAKTRYVPGELLYRATIRIARDADLAIFKLRWC